MVVHLISLVFTGFFLYTASPGSDLFSWHPTCMSVGFVLLLLQAIVVFSPESSLFVSSPRSEKVQLHWILNSFGIVSVALGFASVYFNKEINNRKHFRSWHGQFGLATVVGMLCAACGGILAKYSNASWIKKVSKPINTKVYHATAGMLVFILAMTTVALACYSNWFTNRISGWLWRVCFWCPIVLAVCVARQVTQSCMPRVFVQKESRLDAKARVSQGKLTRRGKKAAEDDAASAKKAD